MRKLLSVLVVLLGFTTATHAEFEVKGFGSIVGGYVFDGDGYVAEYPNVGIYDDKFEIGQETRLGIQASTELGDSDRLTIQIMSRAANAYEPEVEWLYLTHKLTESMEVQAGRMRIPVYKYSEYMDVGIAYPWARIPADTYSLDFVNFNGLKWNYLTGTESLPIRISVLTGKEDKPNSELMTYLFPPKVTRNFTDIYGIVLDASYDFLNVRASYVEADMQDIRTTDFNAGACSNARDAQTIDPSAAGATTFDSRTTFISNCDISFIDLSLTMTFGDFSFMGEFNDYYPFYESFFGSFNYRLGDNAVYLMFSKFDLDGPFEIHDTVSVGYRRDISFNMALKVDFSFFKDEGYNPFADAANPVYKADLDGDGVRETRPDDGDAGIVTIAFDFLF